MIIALTGNIGAGKDLTARIIQYLNLSKEHQEQFTFEEFNKNPIDSFQSWEIHKFANNLKRITAILLGMTFEEFVKKWETDREWRDKPLGEEWIRYAYANGHNDHYRNGEWTKSMNSVPCDKERYEQELRVNWQTAYKYEYTPRTLVQRMGTEAMRDTIHINIHINALFANYKQEWIPFDIDSLGQTRSYLKEPNWIISDLRFENELEAVRKRKGIVIKIDRNNESLDNHSSEKGITDFDHYIDNKYSINILIETVRTILEVEGIINGNR